MIRCEPRNTLCDALENALVDIEAALDEGKTNLARRAALDAHDILSAVRRRQEEAK